MNLQEKINTLFKTEKTAIGFSSIHVENGEELEYNKNSVFPLASVFKVPVMVEVFKQAYEGKFKLSDRIALKEKQKTLPTGVLLSLEEGLELTIKDLVTLMIIVSDNTATTMLMELIGTEKINNTMRKLGLDSISVTMTVHEMFLHAFNATNEQDVDLNRLVEIEKQRPMDYNSVTFADTPDNNVSTAFDMTRLMVMIAKGQVINPEVCEEMINILRQQQYTNRVPCFLPWESAANKTGTMRGLRNDCGLIVRGPKDHIAFSMFTLDLTPLPPDNSTILVRQDNQVAGLMGKIGLLLWEHCGT